MGWFSDINPINVLSNSARQVGDFFSGATASNINSRYAAEQQYNAYLYSKALQEAAQDFNSEEAEKSRSWQESMSNTAYQRQRADLESAGYNPLLAINSGGASAPSGATASSSSGTVGSNFSGSARAGSLGELASTVSSAFGAFGSMSKLSAEIANTKANTASVEADVAKKAAETAKVIKETEGIDPEGRKAGERYGTGLLGNILRSASGIVGQAADNVSSAFEIGNQVGDFITDKVSVNSAKGLQKVVNKANRAVDSVSAPPRARHESPKSSSSSSFSHKRRHN